MMQLFLMWTINGIESYMVYNKSIEKGAENHMAVSAKAQNFLSRRILSAN